MKTIVRHLKSNWRYYVGGACLCFLLGMTLGLVIGSLVYAAQDTKERYLPATQGRPLIRNPKSKQTIYRW